MLEQDLLIECPQCRSNGVTKNPFIIYILIAAIVIAIIPVFGWITSPFLLIIALTSYLIMKVKKIQPMKCKKCKKQFQISQEAYERYKKSPSI